MRPAAQVRCARISRALTVLIPSIAIRTESPLFLLWWPATFGTLISYGLVVGNLYHTDRGKTPPKIFRGNVLRSFAETRRVEALEYCRALMLRPACAATVKMRGGVGADGTTPLTPAEQMELVEAEKAYDQQRYGYRRQLRALFSLEDNDAVRIPLRLYLAFVTSLFAAVMLCNTIIRLGISFKVRVDALHTSYLLPLEKSVSDVGINVYNVTGTSMPSANLSAFMAWGNGHVLSLGNATEAGCTTGAVIAFFLFFGAWLIVMLDFRTRTPLRMPPSLRARRFEASAYPPRVPYSQARRSSALVKDNCPSSLALCRSVSHGPSLERRPPTASWPSCSPPRSWEWSSSS